MESPTLRCIVVDDEPLACQLIASYVERTPGLQLVGKFTHPEQAIEAAMQPDVDIDLAFLDIQMPSMSGMELATRLPERMRVVFITAYSDYAVEGFRINALHYLLKPVSYAEFLTAVDRAAKAVPQQAPQQQAPEYLTIKSEYRLLRLPLDDIEYIESLRDYVKIRIVDQPRAVLSLMSLKSVESMLPPERFMRVHRSFIVNMKHVKTVAHGSIVFGQYTVPVSDSYRARFLAALGSSI